MRQEIVIVSTPSRRRTTLRNTRGKGKLLSKKKGPLKRKIKRSTLVSKLDAVFSEWVRVSHAKNGMVRCYTCPKILPVKNIQNGHYVSRSVRSLRWSEDNCRPQCFGCNIMHGGEPITFRENLVKELGELQVRFIEELRHQLFKPTDTWLLEQIALYTERVIALSPHT